MPEKAAYKYGAQVTIAGAATAEGYTFKDVYKRQADDGNSSDEASDSGDTVAMSIYNVPRVAEPLADAIEDTEAVEVLETSEEETTEVETTEAETDEETEAETEVETEPETLPVENEELPVVSEEALESETDISNEAIEETVTVGETIEETVSETVPEEELAGEFKDGVLLDDVNYVVDTMAPSTDVVDNTPDEVALTGRDVYKRQRLR